MGIVVKKVSTNYRITDKTNTISVTVNHITKEMEIYRIKVSDESFVQMSIALLKLMTTKQIIVSKNKK